MRTAIFDLDGTLADTSGDLIAAANTCLKGMGHGAMLDPIADMETAFAGGRAMLRLGLSRTDRDWGEEDVDGQFQLFIDAYTANIDVYTTLYDGVVPALDRLADAGWVLGICTNKPKVQAEVLLQKLAIRDRFTAMLGADSLSVRKPDPLHLFETIDQAGGNRDRSVLIGDTITDRRTAEAAGIPCVLVSFGPTGRAIEALKPEAMLDHYDEIEMVLESVVR